MNIFSSSSSSSQGHRKYKATICPADLLPVPSSSSIVCCENNILACCYEGWLSVGQKHSDRKTASKLCLSVGNVRCVELSLSHRHVMMIRGLNKGQEASLLIRDKGQASLRFFSEDCEKRGCEKRGAPRDVRCIPSYLDGCYSNTKVDSHTIHRVLEVHIRRQKN